MTRKMQPTNSTKSDKEEVTGKPATGRELVEALRKSGLIGMWKDRTDIGDSAEYARELRKRAETRQRD